MSPRETMVVARVFVTEWRNYCAIVRGPHATGTFTSYGDTGDEARAAALDKYYRAAS